jgi:hypothetical protein
MNDELSQRRQKKKDKRIKNEITTYLHCGECLREWKESQLNKCSPGDYARLNVGYTTTGIQIWCTRHDRNVVIIDIIEDDEEI